MKKRSNLLFILLLIGYLSNAQTPNWNQLEDSIALPGLELNPLKGIATQFSTNGTWNNFPYSIQSKVFMLGEVMNDNGSFNFGPIDVLLEEQAQFGRVSMIQINIDDGRLVSPLDDDFYDNGENPNDRTLGPYKGHQFDLPTYLDSVNRIYYLGKPRTENNSVQTTTSQNIFPYDTPVYDADNNLVSGDGQGAPSILVDYNDPLLIQTVKDLIVQLGQKYDNDPRLFIIHFGIYGIFGEFGLGHGKKYIDDLVDANGNPLLNEAGQPLSETDWEMTEENLADISNTYLTAFTKTKLVARNADVPNSALYGFSDGLYFGASISNIGQNYFFNGLERNGADQNWKNQVIGGEMDPYLQASIWGNENLLDPNSLTPFAGISVKGDPVFFPVQEDQFIENVLEQTHPTFIFQNYAVQNYALGNFGEMHDTPDPLDPIENPYAGDNNTVFWNNALLATKKLGYTFYIKEFNLTASNDQLGIEVNFDNIGVAPMYANWDVEFGYFETNVQGASEFITLGSTNTWNLNAIMPDVADNKRKFIFDNSSNILDNNTEYTFGLRIVNPLSESFTLQDENGAMQTYGPYTAAKPVRFANNTQDADQAGWLTLGAAILSDLDAVPATATNFVANPYEPIMSLGTSQQLSVTIEPVNIPFIWESNLEQIASVDQNGVVTVHLPGNLEIKAITDDGQEVIFPITVTNFWGLPAKIEAEDYSDIFIIDNGSTQDDARVETVATGPESGAFVIGSLQNNDSLEFAVNVEEGGADFELVFRASGKFSIGSMNLLDSNDNLLTSISFDPVTDDFNLYDNYTSSTFSLAEGNQVLTLVVTGSNFNLNWIEFVEIDLCDGFDLSLIGTSCTDLPPGFENGVYTDNCKCEGTPIVAVDQLIENGVYTIESETNNFIVTTTSGGFVNSQLTESGNATKWEFTHLGNNVYTIGSVEFPGELLGVTFGGCGTFQPVGLTSTPDASLPRFQWQAAEVNGKFVFNTVGCSGFSLDIFSANPSTVHLFTSNNAENNQLFNLIPEVPNVIQLIENGVYTIESETNNFIVTTTSGGFVNSQPTESGNATKWEFTHLGNNVYTIGSVEFPGELLGVTFGGCGTFQVVGLTSTPDASLPRFQWQAAEVNGKFVFNTVDCPGFSLDIFSANPSTVHLFTSNNAENNQLFNLIPEVPNVIQLIEDGVYTIESETNNFIVTTTSGGFVNSQPTESGNATKWEFTHLGNNVYTIGSVEFPGELLGVTFGGCGTFQVVGLTATPDASLPRFQWQAAEVNGKFVFNTVDCPGFSLDIFSDNPSTVHLFTSNNAENNQLFNLIPEPIDTEAPIALCNDFSISLLPNEVISITAAQLDGGSTDNDSIASISIDKSTFDINDLGTNDVTLTVEDNSGNVSTCIATVTVIEIVLSVTKFILVDTENNQDLQEIIEGDIIDLASLPSNQFSIRAETTDDVESVRLELDGPVSNTRTENVAPYTLFGDSGGNSNGQTYQRGVYNISADPYSASSLQGNLGTSLSVNFEFTGSPNILSITKFILVDADSGLDLQEIEEGDVIDLANVPSINFSIRAETTADVESVRLELDGPVTNTRTENVAPYTLFGDSGGNSNGQTYQRGVYNISADPYSANNLQGDLGTFLSVNFEFTGFSDILSVTNFILVDADSDLDIQEIEDGDVIDLANLPSNNLSIRAETTSDVESVRLELDGPVTNTRTENVAPYTLFGDLGGSYNGNNLTVGAYSIGADPYSENSRGGIEGISLSINFTLTELVTKIPGNNNPVPSIASNSSSANQASDRNAETNDSGSSKKQIKVWPNPFQDNITLKLDHGKIYNRVFIQDLRGNLLTNVDLRNTIGGENVRLKVEGPSGIYLMYIETSDGIDVKKLVKL